MKEKIFATYDIQAKAFLPMFQASTYGVAERSFSDAVNSENHQFGKYPEDYRLMHLGEIDIVTGVIEPGNPVLVCTAEQVLHGTQDDGKSKEHNIQSVQ